jgi:hypothetical protein
VNRAGHPWQPPSPKNAARTPSKMLSQSGRQLGVCQRVDRRGARATAGLPARAGGGPGPGGGPGDGDRADAGPVRGLPGRRAKTYSGASQLDELCDTRLRAMRQELVHVQPFPPASDTCAAGCRSDSNSTAPDTRDLGIRGSTVLTAASAPPAIRNLPVRTLSGPLLIRPAEPQAEHTAALRCR